MVIQVWIRVGIAVIFSAIFSISAAANQFLIDDALLKKNIGVNWQELKNCQSDADCTFTYIPACKGAKTATINKNFEDKVEKYVTEMWFEIQEEMISTNREEYKKYCSSIKKTFSEMHIVCRNNQCAEVPPTTHLTENEASKIADETMVRHGFDLKELGGGPPSYSEMEQTWHINYMPEGKSSNKKEGNETNISYAVTIDDTTGGASVTKYWEYDVK